MAQTQEKIKFIYLSSNGIKGTYICIKEVYKDGIYSYYLGDNFVFGVEQRFTQADLQNLYNNGYFDLWFYQT